MLLSQFTEFPELTFTQQIKQVHYTSTPALIRSLTRKRLTWNIPGRPDELFLTFDDGPVPEVTPEVLDILENYSVKATFFCVGDNVRKHPDVYEAIRKAGHATGNHTFHHLNGWKTPAAEYLSDIAQCRSMVESRLFRPPYGRIRPSVVKHLQFEYKIVMWSVLTGDYNRELSPEQVLTNSIASTRSGSIIVFHDSIKASPNMLFALPRFLDHFISKGFKFSTIEADNRQQKR